MNKIYFIADTHFSHRNILKYLNRPFMTEVEREALSFANGYDEVKSIRISDESIQLHDNTIIDNINAVVGRDDLLYHLGDFCFGKYEQAKNIRNRINCRNIFLLRGNHDKPDDSRFWNLFAWVKDLYTLKHNGQKIILCHYPMLSWDSSFHGSWHLYGHCHGSLQPFLQKHDLEGLLSMDVGVDSCDYKPISFEEVQRIMNKNVAAPQTKI